MSVRQHLYLITSHVDEDLEGHMSIMERRLTAAEKDKEIPITEFNENTNEYIDVGKQVYLGYRDFDSEESADDPDKMSRVMKEKLNEIDEKWVKQVGLEDLLEDG
jgi:hypothetical protein